MWAPQSHQEQLRAQMTSRNDPSAPQPIPDKDERAKQQASGCLVLRWNGSRGACTVWLRQ